jgi:4-hydroxy-3-methylbut-2-enyl diphosphate reductase
VKVLLASPRGFCAGVDRAIEIVERALQGFGGPVYVRHEIVHNQHVVQALRDKNAVFVDEPSEAPHGARLIYSAHGVSPAVRQAAADNALTTIDATCPW